MNLSSLVSIPRRSGEEMTALLRFLAEESVRNLQEDTRAVSGVLLEAGASAETLADLKEMDAYISAIGGMQELYDVMAGTDDQSELAKEYFDDMMSMYFSPKMMQDIIEKGLTYLSGDWDYEVGSGEYQPTWIVDANNVNNFEGFQGH